MKDKEMAQHYGMSWRNPREIFSSFGAGGVVSGLAGFAHHRRPDRTRRREKCIPYAHSSSSYITRRQVYSAPSRRRRRTYLNFSFSPSPPPYAASPAIPLDRGLPCLLGVYIFSSNLFFHFLPRVGLPRFYRLRLSPCVGQGEKRNLKTRTLKDRRISTGVKTEKKTKRES